MKSGGKQGSLWTAAWELKRWLTRPSLRQQMDRMQVVLDRITSIQIPEVAYFANAARNAACCYIGDNTAIAKIFNGQKLYVDTRDMSLAPHILLEGEWEMDILLPWERLVRAIKPQVIYDVGANVGVFGLVAGAASHATVVHFFDANPRLCELLQKSVSVNGMYGRTLILNKAVSSKSGMSLCLVQPGDYFGSASVEIKTSAAVADRRDVASLESVDVVTVALDDHAKATGLFPDLMKLDVEAHEESVLAGMTDILARRNVTLLAEYTPGAYSENFPLRLEENFSRRFLVEQGRFVKIEKLSTLNGKSDFSMLLLSNTEVDFENL